MSQSGSAAGKVILFGEHAVVYGHPAIGLPLKKKARVWLSRGRGRVQIDGPTRVRASARAASPRDLVKRALGEALEEIDVRIALDFPPMAGFGSSAAIAVALLRAMGARGTKNKLLQRAIDIERVAHQTPSGLDPAIALWETPILFRPSGGDRAARVRALRLGAPLHVVVASAGGHGGAVQSISRIAELQKRRKPLINGAMALLGEATETGVAALRKGDLGLVGQAMDLAHGTLSGLGLVSTKVDKAVRQARDAGALGAKMTGAGGSGGALIALAPDVRRARAITRSLRELRIAAWREHHRDV